jgi:hypothetical protein
MLPLRTLGMGCRREQPSMTRAWAQECTLPLACWTMTLRQPMTKPAARGRRLKSCAPPRCTRWTSAGQGRQQWSSLQPWRALSHVSSVRSLAVFGLRLNSFLHDQVVSRTGSDVDGSVDSAHFILLVVSTSEMEPSMSLVLESRNGAGKRHRRSND